MAENLEEQEQDYYLSASTQDRLENFISALFELKYNIASVEKKHPFLGTELSSLCEQTISQLALPDAMLAADIDMEPSILPMPEPADELMLQQSALALKPKPAVQVIHAAPPAPSNYSSHNHSVSHSLDAAGGLLISALDKMGDGIILVFEKLLPSGTKGKKHPPLIEA